MKKLLYVINTLDGGGAEKILLETVKHLPKDKYKITVLSLINRGVYIDEIKKCCEYKYVFPNLFTGKVNQIYYSLLLRALKIIPVSLQQNFIPKGEYDTAIAYLEGAPTKLVSGMQVTKKLAWVHVDPIKLPYSTKAFIGMDKEIEAYKSYDCILCVSSDLVESFKKKYKIEVPVEFQMNVLNGTQVVNKSQQEKVDIGDSDKLEIVTVGRLAHQKNYELLLRACGNLKTKGVKNFHVSIIGQGPQEKELTDLIAQLDLKNHVTLKGFMKNPYPYINAADFAVCSSRTEGFSTFITESLILGKAILTTKCEGMADLLGDNEYGFICPNSIEGLTEGLERFITDKGCLQQFTEQAKKRSLYFEIDKQIKELEQLL